MGYAEVGGSRPLPFRRLLAAGLTGVAGAFLLVGCSPAPTPDPGTDPREGGDAEGSDPARGDRAAMLRHRVDRATHPEAVCNDGTTPVFYHRPGVGEGVDRWVVWFKGGGSCRDEETCAERGPTLVSSRPWMRDRLRTLLPKGNENSADGTAGGILDPDPSVNPDFHAWNHVYLVYCTSDAWAGTATATLDGRRWAFHGHFVVDAMFDALEDPDVVGAPSLAGASRILLTGSSGGGNGLRNNLDRLAERLSYADVRGVGDAALIPRVRRADRAEEARRLEAEYRLWRPRVDESCAAAAGNEPQRCLRGTYLVENGHLETPVFHHQDQRDPVFVRSLDRGDPADRRLLRETARAIRELLAPVPGAFVPREGHHIILNHPRFNRVRVEGHTMAEVLGNWYLGRPGPTNVIAEGRNSR